MPLSSPPIGYTVSGIIYDEHDRALQNVIVKLFDKDLRTETLLGEKLTDAKGSYQLSFSPDIAANFEYKTADLIIKVFDGNGQLLGQSPIYFNVGETTTIDYKIGDTAYKGINEFDALLELLKPIVESHHVALGQLQENEQYQDISFLSGETGEEAERIIFINTAFAISDGTRVAPDIFYGLFRMGFPLDLPSLLNIMGENIKKALLQAIDENIISSKWGKGLDKIIISLNALAVKDVMEGDSEDMVKFKKVISAVLSEEQQKELVDTYYTHEEEPEKFWEQLKLKPGFTDEIAIEKTKQVLRLNMVTANQPELTTQLLKAQDADADLNNARGFAKFSQEEWKEQIVKAEVSNFPEWVIGTTPEEKTENYAATLEQLHKELYPTTFFAKRLKKDTESSVAHKDQLDIFLEKNPDFDLKTNGIHKQFEQSIFEGIQDEEALKKELKTLNRLYKLADEYPEVNALYAKELYSATDIVNNYGAVQFNKEFSETFGGNEKASKTFQNAVSVHNKVTVLITGYKMRHDVKFYAIDGNQKARDGMNEAPEGYHEMFGDGELCECEHCQSVYSPAAYFVDILSFIKGQNSEAFNELLRRRPDLKLILLNCKNTNTPLPYIDLVNELLEKKVLNLIRTDITTPDPEEHSYETKSNVAELTAMPEHISDTAYSPLKNTKGDAVFSAVLPFDHPLEEIRIYVEKLGWNRLELMEIFYGHKEPGKWDDPQLAAELFGFSTAELAIIHGIPPLTITLPESNKIDAFLDKTKLSYIELLQLLETHFLNPDRVLFIDQEAEEGVEEQMLTCNLDRMFINGASDAWLNKLVRFVRLWKKLGWNIFDLDRALTALGFTDFPPTEAEFNNQLLLPLSHIQRIRQQLNLPMIEVLALFADIDTAIYTDHSKEGQPVINSLYQQMFLNKAVTNPVNDAFTNLEALTDPNELHRETLIAAFGISLPDLALLIKEDDQLTLNTLSRLYRFALLSKSLRSSVPDLLRIISITGNTLAEGSWTTKSLLEFLEDWNLFKSSGIASENYNLLLNTRVGADYKLPVEGELIAAFSDHLDALEEIKKIADTEEQRTQQNARIELIIQSLSGIQTVLEDLTITLTHPDDLVLKNNVESYLGEGNRARLLSLTPDDLIEKLSVLKSSFEEYLWKSTPDIFKTLGFDKAKMPWLEAYKEETGTGLLWNQTVDFADPAVYAAFRRLFYLSKLNKIKTNSSFVWTDLLEIAIINEPNAKAMFFDLFIDLYQVQESSLNFLAGSRDNIVSKGELNLIFPDDFIDPKVLSNLLSTSAILEKLGTTGDQVRVLIEGEATPENAQAAKNLLKARYSNTEWLTVIKPINDGLRIKRRDALVAWLLANAGSYAWRNTNDIYETLLIDVEMHSCMMTSRIKQAISSMQLFISRCLMNLEKYHTNEDENEGEFENETIFLGDKFEEQWINWRKLFRVWEANRKVFLYPENWIEPELRDGKSPFFKDLESQLKQNEVTEETAKEALLAYLEKLDKVANLEMVGLFNDEETKIVHVFGRTKNIPHQYFYRKLEKSIWSAWEKVEVDIEGDHILPVVWNGRLMLFWGQFTEKQEKNSGKTSINTADDNGSMTMESDPPTVYFEIKLAWSEYKKGKWGSKKITKESSLTLNKISDKISAYDKDVEKKQILLTSNFANGKLYIKIFAWSHDYRKYIHNLYLDMFCFDHCNAPAVKIINHKENHFPVEEFEIADYTLSNMMFLDEFVRDNTTISVDYELSIFKSGLIDKHSSNSERFTLFTNTPGQFRLTTNHHNLSKNFFLPFFYRNDINSFFVISKQKLIPDLSDDVLINYGLGTMLERQATSLHNNIASTGVAISVADRINRVGPGTSEWEISVESNTVAVNQYINYTDKRYMFQTFYHPYVCEYIKELNTKGFEALYTSGAQNKDPKILFTTTDYNPNTNLVLNPYPREEVDFSYTGSYALYNWELFFHIPLLIATRLSQNQKFEEARKWFHFIFDPTKSSSAGSSEGFWITQPFKKEIREGIVSIEKLLLQDEYREELSVQLENWEDNPFNPHAVARLRISAYMRNTVLRYIDNLIAWGDQLFRRDTIESINEATLLYILASNILGKKPEVVPARGNPEVNSFSSMAGQLDPFNNIKAELEAFISHSPQTKGDEKILMPYFCLPKNDFLLNYWDTIADRLFKIRHCQNIEGIFRQLPLFEPPIDPALLIRSTAAGLDLNTILNDVNSGLPYYRFQVMLQQANELCNDVKLLGNLLLSALEKKDGEEMALLRSGHEQIMLEMIKNIKEKQRDETKANLDSLQASRITVEQRMAYYNNNTSNYLNPSEKFYFDSTNTAINIQKVLEMKNYLASVLAFTPEFKAGSGFTLGTSFGGSNLAAAAHASINALQSIASLSRLQGESANIKGGYDRRMDEWKFQVKSAELELKQIDKQIIAAEIRLAITEKEIENHTLQMEQSAEVDNYMRSKFTNAELYDWMVEQVSVVYFQSYELAYATAKKAEKCLQHELGLEGTNYVQFGYWDSLKKGLLSGEKLQYDLRRLEHTYLEENKREYEIIKHISLTLLDPLALLTLKANGTCEFEISEVLYDMDHPGQYFRRLKSVSISLPCIAGPYTSVSSTLSLLNSRYRKNTTGTEYTETPHIDSRFNYYPGPIQSIASSHGQNDSGIFELNFRDERYLPFEGTGAIGNWRLELPTEIRQFDYNTISDIILHVKYTAREGSNELKNLVNSTLKNRLDEIGQHLGGQGLHLAINIKHDLPSEWHLLIKTGTVDLLIDKSRFPYMVQPFEAEIENVMFVAIVKDNPTNVVLSIVTSLGATETIHSTMENLEIFDGSNSDFILNSMFNLLIENVENLEELIMVVKYKFDNI